MNTGETPPLATHIETETAPPKRGQQPRNLFTKKEWGLLWKTVLGTLAVVAATMGPLIGWYLKVKEEQIKIKDDQIAQLKSSNDQLTKSSPVNLDSALKELQVGLTRLGMAFPISTWDGRVAMGQGMSGKPTPITEMMVQAQNQIASKEYDAAEESLAEIDRLWTNFPGANLFRFHILQAKGDGYQKEAEAMADRVIPTLVDGVDLLRPAYAFSINAKLARSEKPAAEQLFLKMLRTFPNDTNYVSEFERVFGYKPSAKAKNPAK